LQKAGVKALQSKDYRTAIDLLKRAVDADMSVKDAWYDLGQAYAGATIMPRRSPPSANRSNSIQSQRANGDLAMELQQPASPTTQSRPSASNWR